MGDVMPLGGIKILDLSRAEPGAFCTMLLADFGADVIMIEAIPVPGQRSSGVRQSLPGGTSQEYRRYRAYNRNKRSLGLDLKSEPGKSIFYKLAGKADIMVEGFRPGVARRLNVDYETISGMNPRIIYCSITGYGQDGPYCELPGHDINYVGVSGVLDVIGEKNGEPVPPLNLVADLGGGSMHAALGIMAALLAREKTGKGQYIDISFTDSAISLMTGRFSEYFESGVPGRRGETVLGGAYPYYNLYKTGDGKYIALACIEPWLWEKFCREIGHEEFVSSGYRLEHVHKMPDAKSQAVFQSLKELFLTKTRDEWFRLLDGKDIPVSKVNSMEEVFEDEQIIKRRMLVEAKVPEGDIIKQVGMAIKLSETPGTIRKAPPLLGEHTSEILSELGYEPGSIEEMKREKIIY